MDLFLDSPEVGYDDYQRAKLTVLSKIYSYRVTESPHEETAGQITTQENCISESGQICQFLALWEEKEDIRMSRIDNKVIEETGFTYTTLKNLPSKFEIGDLVVLTYSLHDLRDIRVTAQHRQHPFPVTIIPFFAKRNQRIEAARRAVATRLPQVEAYAEAELDTRIKTEFITALQLNGQDGEHVYIQGAGSPIIEEDDIAYDEYNPDPLLFLMTSEELEVTQPDQIRRN